MDFLFVPLAEAVGASVDQIKLISCLLISFPLANVFARIHSPALKHLFSFSVTVFNLLITLNMFGAFCQLLFDVLVTYYLARGMKDKRMPWVVFVFVIGHLLINHIIRAVFKLSYETMEVTTPQMVLVMKLSSFAWNVHDGRRPTGDLDKWQTERRITDAKFPSLLAFLGYSFYFPGFLVGPFVDYFEYDTIVSGKPKSSTSQKHVKNDMKPLLELPPGRNRAGYSKLFIGLVHLGLYVTFIPKFSHAGGAQSWFLTKTLFERFVYIQIAGIFERTKYYAIWTLSEGSTILTGLGFTGYSPSGSPIWEGAKNAKVLSTEFPENFRMVSESWNIKTSIWLKECVYKRVTKKGAKPGFASNMITYLTSAIWHGVAPGYYLAFMYFAFLTSLGRITRSSIRPLLIPIPGDTTSTSPSFAKRVYDVAGTIFTVILVNYGSAAFMLGTIEDSLELYSRLAWYGYIIPFASLAFFYGGGSRVLKKMQAKRLKKAEGKQKAAELTNGAEK